MNKPIICIGERMLEVQFTDLASKQAGHYIVKKDDAAERTFTSWRNESVQHFGAIPRSSYDGNRPALSGKLGN